MMPLIVGVLVKVAGVMGDNYYFPMTPRDRFKLTTGQSCHLRAGANAPAVSLKTPSHARGIFLHTTMHNDKEYYHTTLNRMRQLESSLERGTMALLLFSCVMTFSCPETAEE